MNKENIIKFFKIVLKILNYKIVLILILSWLTISYVNSNSRPQEKIENFFLLNLKPEYFTTLFKYWLFYGLACIAFWMLRTSGFIKTGKTYWKFVNV